MVRRAKKKTGPAYKRGRPFKLILPPDISARIEKKARAEGRPQSRVIVNELAAHPHLAAQAELGVTVRDMQVALAQHEARLRLAELSEKLLRVLDEAFAAPTDAQRQAPFDDARVTRAEMLEIEREAAETEREQLAARIKVLERQIAMFTALPAIAIEKDDLPAAKAELARLQQLVDQGAVAESKAQRASKPPSPRRTKVTA